MARGRRRSLPGARAGAELIIKSNYECSSRFPGWMAPGLFLLGNKEGFLWLSEFLAWFAGQVSEVDSFETHDPDNHEHIDDKSLVNRRLSDEIGLMVGVFSARHRRRVLTACSATRARRIAGSPVRHLADNLAFIESCCEWNDEIATGTVGELVSLIERAEGMLGRLRAKANKSQLDRRTPIPPK